MPLSKAFILQLLLSGKLKFEDGKIQFGGLNLIMVTDTFLATYLHLLERKNWVNYFLAWVSGLLAIYKFSRTFKLNKPDSIYIWGMRLGELIGLGKFKTHYYDWKRFTYFEIKSDPILNLYPNDYFLLGIMGGGGSLVHQQVCQAVLLEKTKQYTKYLVGTEDELKRRGLWEKIEEDYNLKVIYPLQKKLFGDIEQYANDMNLLVQDIIYPVKEIL